MPGPAAHFPNEPVDSYREASTPRVAPHVTDSAASKKISGGSRNLKFTSQHKGTLYYLLSYFLTQVHKCMNWDAVAEIILSGMKALKGLSRH